MSAHFHSLTIRDVRRETKDCVSISFEVPTELREVFAFTAGQYVNLRAVVDSEELRRSYSLCSTPYSGEWRVAIKRVEGGRFSEYANTKMKAGDTIDVMPPDGKFCFEPSRDAKRHVIAIAAGSGVTPILSIISSVLEHEPQSRVTLIYGNRRVRDIIFKEQIEDLRDRFLARFQLFHVLSQEPNDSPVLNGRIDRKKLLSILKENGLVAQLNRAYLCGPDSMIEDAAQVLHECGLPHSEIRRELFASPAPSHGARAKPVVIEAVRRPSASVTTIADGIERVLQVPFDGESVLEVALAAGIDAPYACKAGVCCTCRAQVLEGEVKMDANFTLEDHEVRRGFVLTCQSHPITPTVKLSYDAR
ncbi:MAG: 1,2-phenylacetyl-CoA epoxidase subunit PaaE [Casimicrobium sp.]